MSVPEAHSTPRLLRTRLPQDVWLRPLTSADADEFARHLAADLPRLSVHLPWPPVTSEPAGAAAFLRAYEDRLDGRALLLGALDGAGLLGGAMLHRHDPRARTAEIGCWVVSRAEGHGVAAATCRELLRYGRHELALEGVIWTCTTVNAPSRRLAERLGFVHETTQPDAYVLNGRHYDLDVLALRGGALDALRSSEPKDPRPGANGTLTA